MTSGNGVGGNSRGRLVSLVERIERLEEDKKAVAADLGEVYAEAKGEGFDVKILRKVIRRRGTDKVKIQEEEALIDLYESALAGSQPDDFELPPKTDARKAKGASKPTPAAPGETPLEQAIKAAVPPEELQAEIDKAIILGAYAASEGLAITANPFPAGSPHRVAWDQGWCDASGSDGMDPDPAWRPEGGEA